jgi:hypothetical protein
VTMSIEVRSGWDVDGIEEYSFELVVSSVLFNVPVSVVLEMSLLVSSVN